MLGLEIVSRTELLDIYIKPPLLLSCWLFWLLSSTRKSVKEKDVRRHEGMPLKVTGLSNPSWKVQLELMFVYTYMMYL